MSLQNPTECTLIEVVNINMYSPKPHCKVVDRRSRQAKGNGKRKIQRK